MGQPVPVLTTLEGSESGLTTYRTQVAVGPPINSGQQQNEVDVRVPMLSSMLRWPVTVSYFKKDSPASDPALYEVKSEIYDNGISCALLLDYNAFRTFRRVDLVEYKRREGVSLAARQSVSDPVRRSP
jgi:hypothetical protein